MGMGVGMGMGVEVGECEGPLFPKGLPPRGGGEEGRRRLSRNGVKVVQTRIEGGSSAVKASGGLSLQQVGGLGWGEGMQVWVSWEISCRFQYC